MLRVPVLPRGNDRVPLCARFLRHSAHSHPRTARGLTILPARTGVHPCVSDAATHVSAASPIRCARRGIGLYAFQRSRQPDNPQSGLPRPRPLGALLRGHQLELRIRFYRGLGVGPHPACLPSRTCHGLTEKQRSRRDVAATNGLRPMLGVAASPRNLTRSDVSSAYKTSSGSRSNGPLCWVEKASTCGSTSFSKSGYVMRINSRCVPALNAMSRSLVSV